MSKKLRNPLNYWNLIKNRPEISNGKINLPDEHGFGWVLDTNFIKKYSS